MRIFLASLLSLLLAMSASAGVYMQKNPDGSVEFTDAPTSPEAKEIQLKPNTSYTPPPAPAAQTSRPATQDRSTGYDSISITQPADDVAIRENAGNVSVSIALSPALKDKHSLNLKLDGSVAASGPQTQFLLSNVDRGTHTLQADVVDEHGTVLLSSKPITFHLLRFSILQH